MAALGRRRDLPALLDRHAPLGPDQAARRLGVRRTDFDLIVGRLGWQSPVASVGVDCKHHGRVTTVPLYDAQEIALLEVVRPSVDWRAVHTVTAGCRFPLAGLRPVAPGGDRVFLAEVGRIARVGRLRQPQRCDYDRRCYCQKMCSMTICGSVVRWVKV